MCEPFSDHSRKLPRGRGEGEGVGTPLAMVQFQRDRIHGTDVEKGCFPGSLVANTYPSLALVLTLSKCHMLRGGDNSLARCMPLLHRWHFWNAGILMYKFRSGCVRTLMKGKREVPKARKLGEPVWRGRRKHVWGQQFTFAEQKHAFRVLPRLFQCFDYRCGGQRGCQKPADRLWRLHVETRLYQ